jgi:hypothetical protein
MEINELTQIAVDAAYKIHTRFGPGLLESAYAGWDDPSCESSVKAEE